MNTTSRSTPIALAAATAVTALLVTTLANAQADSWYRKIPYQGRVEHNGVAISGSADLAFSIYSAATGGSAVWTETKTGVRVNAGNFVVVLGDNTANPLPASLFTRKIVYLAISVDGVALQGRQPILAVPFATTSAEPPIGTVIDWWDPDPNATPPFGYVECAGQVLNDADSPLNGQTLPDLRGRFVRGARTGSIAVGSSGGYIQHHHVIGGDGAHNHTQSGGDLRTGTSGSYAPAEQGFGTSSNGSHNHSGWTGWATENGSGANDLNHEMLPPYVALRKLMRVK